MGEYEHAIEILLQLVEEDQNPRFLFLLSNAQLQEDDREGARKSILKLLAIDSSFPISEELSSLFQSK